MSSSIPLQSSIFSSNLTAAPLLRWSSNYQWHGLASAPPSTQLRSPLPHRVGLPALPTTHQSGRPRSLERLCHLPLLDSPPEIGGGGGPVTVTLEAGSLRNLWMRRLVCKYLAMIVRDDGSKACFHVSPPLWLLKRNLVHFIWGAFHSMRFSRWSRKYEDWGAPRFSIVLTKKEMEDNMLTMTRSKPYQRPMKREINVKKKLDVSAR